MTVDMFLAFAAGAAVSFVVSSVFAGAKYWEMWQQSEELKDDLWHANETITDLRSKVEPRQWDRDWNIPIIEAEKKERIYEKYEDLVRPGTEVVDLKDAEDEDFAPTFPVRSSLVDEPWEDPMGHKDWSYE